MCVIGVQSAAVNVVCELARKNPKNYLSLAPVFFKLMTTSTNNWMLIKIIKLVRINIILVDLFVLCLLVKPTIQQRLIGNKKISDFIITHFKTCI